MKGDLTRGPVMKSMLLFAMPMILGNMLQQCYNVADTLIVGRFLGPDALAAVGSAFSLMTFLTSVILGLCMGSGALFSIRFGQRDLEGMRESVFASFLLIGAVAILINLAVFFGLEWILVFAGARWSDGTYAGISDSNILWDFCHFSVQLFCLFAAGGGKFRGAAGVSGGFCRIKYCSGSVQLHPAYSWCTHEFP